MVEAWSCIGTGLAMVNLPSSNTKSSAEGRQGGIHRFCRQIFQHTLDAVLLTRPDGSILSANPAACRLFGRTEDELKLIGRGGVVDGNDPRLAAALEERDRNGSARVELTFIRSDGSTFTGELTSSVFHDAAGNELTSMIIRDVTDRRRVEEAHQESEERFRLAMEVTSDGLWDWDVEAGTGYFSPGCYRMLGYEPGELAMTIPVWLDFIHPEDRDRTAMAKTDCIENRTDGFEETFRMQHRSGRWVWVLGRGKAVHRGAGGKAQRLLGTHVDITERKAAEDRLAASRIRYQSLFDHSSTAVWEGDFSAVRSYLEELRGAGEDFRTYFEHHPEAVIRCAGLVKILDVNLESLYLFKMRRKADLIRSMSGFFTEDSLPVFREALLALAEGETSFVGEMPIRNHLGEPLHIHMRLRVIPGCEQTLSNVHASFIDISDRKNAELKLQQLNDELEKRVRDRTSELESSIKEMESFCHSVSHELRAPIARVEGFCHLLTESLDHEDPQGIRHCAERLGYSSRRIRAVIDALLSIHRLGRADMKLEAVNLSDLAGQTMDELAERDPSRRPQVVIAPDIVAQGDRRMLGICLQNLLENAVKYTGKTAEPLIEFGTVESFGDTVFFVRDNGAGFDMAFANKLFQPFSRLHNDEEFAGSGIGLATVQRIVGRHCGQIWAEASPGKGATFYFTLGSQ